MKTKYSQQIPFNGHLDWLYTVGTHNEKSEIAFTTLESAVVNSV